MVRRHAIEFLLIVDIEYRLYDHVLIKVQQMRAFKSSIFAIVLNKVTNMATGFIDDYRWTIPQA